jgi:hypothetical protein
LRPSDALLLAALRAAPRRYRLPPLPDGIEAASASNPETALAFAIEGARCSRHHRSPPPAGLQDLFTRSLAALIRASLAAEGGDPAFQALVLRARDAEVHEYVRLARQAPVDRRSVRAATDAFAHPGKLRAMAAGPLRDALSRVHELAAAGEWGPLAGELRQLAARPGAGEQVLAASGALLDDPALARLDRLDELATREAVQGYLALCGQRGPAAGSDAAAAQGRASARTGEAGEQATVQAFRAVAELLEPGGGQPGGIHVVRGLRTPRGFPGDGDKAKEEWDAAIVRSEGGGPADIVLLAEVKASPAAATPDFPRLHRGLQRLAHASAGRSYVFPCADGDVRVSGESLRRLQPHGRGLPAHVIYCCSAPAEVQPQLLSAASKAVLLAEPASLAFAGLLARGASPPDAMLAPVWEALTTSPALRSALHQDETSRAVREAMLHPADLLAAVAAHVADGGPA